MGSAARPVPFAAGANVLRLNRLPLCLASLGVRRACTVIGFLQFAAWFAHDLWLRVFEIS
jgi:hypothetical protein